MITAREIVNAAQQRLGLEGSAVVGMTEKMLQEVTNLAKNELTLDVLSGKSTLSPAKQLLLRRALSSSTATYGKENIFYGTPFNGALVAPDRDFTGDEFPSDKYAYLVPTPTDFLFSTTYVLETIAGGVALPNTPYKLISDLSEYSANFHNHFMKPNDSWAWVYEQLAYLAAGPSTDGEATPHVINADAYRKFPFEGVTLKSVENSIANNVDLNYSEFPPTEVQTGRVLVQLILGKDVRPSRIAIHYFRKPQDVRFNIRFANTPGGEQGLDWDKALLPDLVDYIATRYSATRNTQTESYQVQSNEKNT